MMALEMVPASLETVDGTTGNGGGAGRLLPVCAWCQRVRDDSGEWLQVDRYLELRTAVRPTHGVCPKCTVGLLGG